jgi:ATP-dependent Clp protease ATP-binding subunit ClpA
MVKIQSHTDEAEKMNRWRSLEGYLEAQVRGQSEAIKELTTALLAGEMGHVWATRPLSFCILLGPTGSGKTAACLAASRHLYGTDAIVRLNMAEYPERKDLARLIGEGLHDGGLLDAELTRLSQVGGRIILIDEIEKAHKDIANVFLGMEAAELMLANRKKWNLTPFHLICTSNLGSADCMEMGDVPYAYLTEHISTEAMQHFRPEVWARFTHHIVYRPLSYDIQLEICEKMLSEELHHQAKLIGRKLRADPQVFRFLVARGYSEKLGARPMRNAIEFHVRRALVRSRLQGIPPGELVINVTGDCLSVCPDMSVTNIRTNTAAGKVLVNT